MLPLEQFKAFVVKHRLFSDDDRILLAVSGGKDSVLMARLFKLAGFNFSIAHCNFNLRGREAKRDEIFVKLLAKELNAPFYHITFDTKAYAKQHRISTQMAARALRYNWFDTLLDEYGYGCVALAQHQNDAVETILINLVRGTGISGLHGILPKRNRYIRPLLFLTRTDIDELAEQLNIDFVEDSSNKEAVYVRNNIRLNVVPHLRKINPKLESAFLENAERFAETERLLNLVVEKQRKTLFIQQDGYIVLKTKDIEELDPQFLLFFELMKPFGFTSDVCKEVLQSMHKQSGTSFYSKSHRLTFNREELILTEKEQSYQETILIIRQGESQIYFMNQKISIKMQELAVFEPAKNRIYVDAQKLIFPLICRKRQKGDKFKPFGMNNFKLLSDFLIGQKVSLQHKDRIPLVINGNGEIIWVVGMRQDERYKVNAATKKVAIFELLN